MMNDWWREPETQICQFYIPAGNGGSHVLTLHGRLEDGEPWEYAIVQWWYRSPTVWLSWRGNAVLDSSPDLMVSVE